MNFALTNFSAALIGTGETVGYKSKNASYANDFIYVPIHYTGTDCFDGQLAIYAF